MTFLLNWHTQYYLKRNYLEYFLRKLKKKSPFEISILLFSELLQKYIGIRK
jgi:hypothetical protein